MKTFKGHELIEVTPLRGKAHYRCQLCKGLVIDHPGLGILDENSNTVPPDDSRVPQCEGPIKQEKNSDAQEDDRSV